MNFYRCSALVILMIVLQACAKPPATTSDKIAASKDYASCSAFYEILSTNFKNSVQQGISEVGGVMLVASKSLATDVYGKEKGSEFAEKEKESQLPIMRTLFDEKRDIEAKAKSDHCHKLGQRVVNAIKNPNK